MRFLDLGAARRSRCQHLEEMLATPGPVGIENLTFLARVRYLLWPSSFCSLLKGDIRSIWV